MNAHRQSGGEEKARSSIMNVSSNGCYYPNTEMESYGSNNPDIYNMEVIGFPPRNSQHQTHTANSSAMWKGFDSHNMIALLPESSTSWQQQNRFVFDDSSFKSCVFPSEANEKPSQGLSLSLCSTNPSIIALQSVGLRQQDDARFVSSSSRDGFFGKSMGINQHMMQEGLGPNAEHLALHDDHNQGHFQMGRRSKYLGPVQELLNELCNLGTNQTHNPPKIKPHKPSSNQWRQDDDDHQNNNNNATTTTSSSKNQSLHTLQLLELQKRKTKLLSMLQEVDGRYRHYCEQMKGVVSSFEAVAGSGAARVYSASASKAMSRHFRCLRDGIVGEIGETRKGMGEKDCAHAGGTHGETPRLRLLDEALRQQKAFQQIGMMESHPWRPQRGLPERAVSALRAWLFEHFLHPYPNDVDKHILARQTGLSRSQVSNWFINARVRLWKPMVEEMYLEETKDGDKMASSALDDANNIGRPNLSAQSHLEDQKSKTDIKLLSIDSQCLSSIVINNPVSNDTKNTKTSTQIHHHFGKVKDPFGAMEFDFTGGASHANGNVHQNQSQNQHHHHHHHFGGGSGGASLTLGLQQHGGRGTGVNLAFSPTSHNPLLYHRSDHIEDCQPVQFSVLDTTEGQGLPYRNLMGAQLLHDLAG